MIMEETSDKVLRRALGTGERLLWLGKPKTGSQLRSEGAFLIPFGVGVWCWLAVFWKITAFIPDSPLFPFRLWGIAFICVVGFYLVFGHFIIDARLRGRTAYGVTNERVLIVSGLSQRIKSLQLTSLGEVTLWQEEDGSGTIIFESTPDFSHPWYHESAILGTFKRIEDAKSTYDLIRKARREAFEKM
jgi:hypothetical protein